jgi:ATP-binding cassette subfamily B protein/subfamily B ATP-binding cassette protein MsbA
MPDGYQSSVGDRGGLLSGGERQRVSIARALFKNAPILVLDEATSALDSASEVEVQKGLDLLMQGKTTIVIAHRLSTVLHANKIVVMKEGKIVEVGTHGELLKKEGEYSRFLNLQSLR